MGGITTNVPIISDEQQENVEGGNPKTQILSQNYFENMAHMYNVSEELSIVNDKTFFCSVSKIKEPFHFCMDRDCNMPIVELR